MARRKKLAGARILVSNDDGVRDRLNHVRDVVAPVIRDAVRLSGGIPLKPIIRRALHMGDELHSRNTAASLLATTGITAAIAVARVLGGWLIDRYGLRWQIVPRALVDMMADPDPVRSKRVTDAMMKMVKLDIATLERAYGSSSSR